MLSVEMALHNFAQADRAEETAAAVNASKTSTTCAESCLVEMTKEFFADVYLSASRMQSWGQRLPVTFLCFCSSQ